MIATPLTGYAASFTMAIVALLKRAQDYLDKYLTEYVRG
jgi:hypothetical protein